MRRVIGIALVIVAALVFLNDGGRWVNAQSQLNERTTQLAEWAAENVPTQSRDMSAPIVTGEGAKRGVRVYQYEQDQYDVKIWGSADVNGTWVIGPYVALLNGTPIDQALSVPFVVRSYTQARLQ